MKFFKISLVIIYVIGLTGISHAQYCKFFAMSEGTALSYENYNHKGKVTVKSKTTCSEVITDKEGAIIYKVKTEIISAKDAPISSREYEMKCKDGKFYVDTESYADPNALKQFQDMAIDVNEKDMEYPEELSIGQDLPDAIVTISPASKNSYVMIITNRKVIGNEPIETPAGSFDCFKISYNMEVKAASDAKFKINEYIAVGIGKVKTETYNLKGKLKSSSLLVELKK